MNAIAAIRAGGIADDRRAGGDDDTCAGGRDIGLSAGQRLRRERREIGGAGGLGIAGCQDEAGMLTPTGTNAVSSAPRAAPLCK
jgi:hypothetical protein